MRNLFIAAMAFASITAATQEAPVLLSGRPDVIVTVRKSDVGADYVRIQALDEDYSAELLRSQIERIGRYNGTQVRGIEVSYAGSEGAGRILTASFATDRLMDQAAGTLELNAFAKAFAGGEGPITVNRIAVMFEGFDPAQPVTVAEWSDENVEVASHYDKNLRVVDYRVTLKTQDPDKISIPATLSESTNREEAPSNTGFNPWLIAAIVGGAALLGLLVYFVLRPRGQVAAGPGPE
jgi:hypothetical protein